MKNQAVNPYLPNYEYVPDGEPHVFGERIYIYGSHDKFNGNAFCMKDYVCWSASVSDLSSWKYEGVIYEKWKDSRIPDAKNRRLFAPDVQRGADGRYYLYYAFDFSGIIGVAVCDTPAGSYEYYGHVHYPDGIILGEKEGDVFQYDPGVFIDTTGSIYLYSGFCPTGEVKKRFVLPRPFAKGGMVMELETDMITIKKDPSVLLPNAEYTSGTGFEGHGFFEAASMRRIGDKYCFLYSSENGHELCYAISNRPDGEFTYQGVIISNGDIGYNGRKEQVNYTGTNHGSIEEINGQWYVFYQRQTNGNPYSRQGCAEKIQIFDEVKIPQVEMTSCGLNGGPLLGKGRYNAGIACCLLSKDGAAEYEANKQISKEHPYFTQDGEDRESDPGQYITNLQSGAMVGFKYFDIQDLQGISVTVRGDGIGKIKIYKEFPGELIGSIDVNKSPDWTTISQSMCINPGVTALWFGYEGCGAIDFESFTLI